MADLKENCIEWLNGQDTISVTLSQGRYINRVKELAEKYPEKVQILHVNEDGSIFAHLPLKSLKLNIIPAREMGEEEKIKARERLKKARGQSGRNKRID